MTKPKFITSDQPQEMQTQNRQPLPNAGKRASIAKREKTYNRCQARENVQPLPSAGKRTTIAKRGKHA